MTRFPHRKLGRYANERARVTYTFVDTLPVVEVPGAAVAVALGGHAALALLVVVPQRHTRRVARLLQRRLRVHGLVVGLKITNNYFAVKRSILTHSVNASVQNI